MPHRIPPRPTAHPPRVPRASPAHPPTRSAGRGFGGWFGDRQLKSHPVSRWSPCRASERECAGDEWHMLPHLLFDAAKWATRTTLAASTPLHFASLAQTPTRSSLQLALQMPAVPPSILLPSQINVPVAVFFPRIPALQRPAPSNHLASRKLRQTVPSLRQQCSLPDVAFLY